jgi:TRAP-type C4-dicarboxylate transport system permease small subunit
MQAAIDLDRQQTDVRTQTAEGVRRGMIMTLTALTIVAATYGLGDSPTWYGQLLAWTLVGLGITRIFQGVREGRHIEI